MLVQKNKLKKKGLRQGTINKKIKEHQRRKVVNYAGQIELMQCNIQI